MALANEHRNGSRGWNWVNCNGIVNWGHAVSEPGTPELGAIELTEEAFFVIAENAFVLKSN